ncbi:MAG TPA: ELWxxDGT repeat protein [Herpetosiphonaceae bacterium]
MNRHGSTTWSALLALLVLLAFVVAQAPSSEAQSTAVLVKDLNPVTDSSAPVHLQKIGSTLYFFADDGIHDHELWRSDGTAAGTRLVKDLLPGWASPAVHASLVVGSSLFFIARDSLWRSDGTEAGSMLLLHDPRILSYSPMVQLNGVVYFMVGSDLWRSDGTVAGTTKVTALSIASHLYAANNLLFFAGKDATNGVELWKSDGTAAGTRLVKDIASGWIDSNPDAIMEVGGVTYFTAATSAQGRELYRTDGTPEGTVLIKDFVPGASSSSNLRLLADVDGTLYLMANTPDASLWRTNGTEASTVLVKTFTGRSLEEYGAALGNRLIFHALTGGTSKEQLWVSDGTPEGTRPLTDVPLDGNSGMRLKQMVQDPDRNLGFLDTSRGLWRTDGTPEGTFSLSPVADRPIYTYDTIQFANGQLFFDAPHPVYGYELWASDGTVNGHRVVTDINKTGHNSSPDNAVELNGSLIFTAADDLGSRFLWKSDGTTDGTTLIKKSAILIGGAKYTRINNTIFFIGTDTDKPELWRTNGTEAGTIKIKGFSSVGAPNNFQLTSVQDTLFFTANDGVHGVELWKSDGSTGGTTLVADLAPGAAGSSLMDLVAMGDRLFFVRGIYGDDDELWQSDGTAAGTTFITKLKGFIGYPGDTYYLTAVNNALFFYAENDDAGVELWTSDGTAAGTRRVADINPGPDPSAPQQLMAVGNQVFFVAYDDLERQPQLWRSDGTAQGTIRLTNFTGDYSYEPYFYLFTSYRGKVFFRVDDNVHGIELWQSDGTVAGTRIVADIAPGARSAYTEKLTTAGGWLFFLAEHPDYGTVIWQTDGTEAGTRMALDARSGPSGGIWWLRGANGMLFFSGADTRGVELWRLPVTAHPAITPRMYVPRVVR